MADFIKAVIKSDKLRLDRAVIESMDNDVTISRAALQRLIRTSNASVNGKIVSDPGFVTRLGDVCVITLPPPDASELKPQSIPLTITYEDDDILVIDKPTGLVVHPGAGNREGTMANALLAHCGKSLSGIGGVSRPGIVHRLDKDTSGLLVVAKNDVAHRFLSSQFSDRSLSRKYMAIVHGTPVPASGKIEATIGRSTRDRKKMAVKTAGGKNAITRYRVIESFGNKASLVECKLETGRTHQIRVHMAHIRHPVWGDKAYGKNAKPCFGRQALHAVELELIHPRTGKKMKFKSELPEDMAQLLMQLKDKE